MKNLLLVASSNFREWVFGDVSVAVFRVDFPKPLITSCYQIDHLVGVIWIQFGECKWSFHCNGWNAIVANALSENWIAADVAFGRHMELLGIQVPNDIAKIQIAIHDRHHVFATDFAAIPFITLGQTNVLD